MARPKKLDTVENAIEESKEIVADIASESTAAAKDLPAVKKIETVDDPRIYNVIYVHPTTDDTGGVTVLMDVLSPTQRSPSLGIVHIDFNGASFQCFMSQIVALNTDGTALPEGTKSGDRFKLKISIADISIQRVDPYCRDLKTIKIY